MRLVSFAYSFGAPRGVEHVFDLRHYPSPSADLCARYDGRDRRLRRELLRHPQYQQFLADIRDQWDGDEDVTLGVRKVVTVA